MTSTSIGIETIREVSWCRTCWPRISERANILATAACILLEHEVLHAVLCSACTRHFNKPTYDYAYGTGSYSCHATGVYWKRGEPKPEKEEWDGK